VNVGRWNLSVVGWAGMNVSSYSSSDGGFFDRQSEYVRVQSRGLRSSSSGMMVQVS
jgi:hypothetical protein